MSALFTVADVAAKLQLKPQPNGKFCGAPEGTGATKDGFVLCPEGNAFSNGGAKFTSIEVAELAGIDPGQYEPVANFRAARGNFNGTSSAHPAPRARVSSSNGTSNGSYSNGTTSSSSNGDATGTSGAASSTPKPKKPAPAFNWNAATKFDYRDETGALLYQVGRLDFPDEIDPKTGKSKKDFRQRQPDGAGGWIYNLDGVARVLFNLANVKAAGEVIFCEGEKTATAWNEDLKAANLYGPTVATTTAQGAGNTLKSDLTPLHGKAVAISPDNNTQGEKQRDDVLSAIGERAKCKVIELPDRGDGGDYVDFCAAGGTLETALEMIDAAPIWTPPAKAKRFPLLTLAQLKAKPKPVYLIHGLLMKADTSLLTAKHASFKSFITLNMAFCIACNIPFHGLEVAHGLVVYIAAEGAVGLTKRAQALCAHHNIDPGENFVVYDSPIQIHDARARADLIEELAELKPVLIVLDTLARCAVGLEENSSKDMGEFADALDALAKESGAHVLTVHHNNKGGDYRGSSAIPAAVGTHLSLERTGDTVTLKTEKQKDAEELPALVFEKVEVTIPGTYGEESSLVFERLDTRPGSYGALNPIEQKCLDALREVYGEESVSSAQWKRAAEQEKGVPESTFHKARKALVKTGRVVVVSGEEGGKGKNAALYAIASGAAEDDSMPENDSHFHSTESVEQNVEQPTEPTEPRANSTKTPDFHSIEQSVEQSVEQPVEQPDTESNEHGTFERETQRSTLSVEQNESVEHDSKTQRSTLYTPLGVESVEQRVRSTGPKPKRKTPANRKSSNAASEFYAAPATQPAPGAESSSAPGDETDDDAADGDLF